MPTAFSLYLSDIRTLPPLTKDQEMEIGRKISEGMIERRTELVVPNLGFVVTIAREYQHRGLPLDDLVNEGNLGLIHAASRYDHQRGVKFITYAAFWVRKAILKALDDQGAMIRVPEYQRRKASRQPQAVVRPARQGGAARREPPPSPHRSQFPSPYLRQVSLEDPARGQGRPRVADLLVDETCKNPEHGLIQREDLDLLAHGLRRLSERERTVLIGRYGLSGGRTLKLEEIGSAIGVSRERVRQIETSAREKLRALLRRSTRAAADEPQPA